MDYTNPILMALNQVPAEQLQAAGTYTQSAMEDYNRAARERQAQEMSSAALANKKKVREEGMRIATQKNKQMGSDILSVLGAVGGGPLLGGGWKGAQAGAALGGIGGAAPNPVIGGALDLGSGLADKGYWKKKKKEAFGPSTEEINGLR